MFLASGIASAAWAPLVPLVKHRLELTDTQLGLFLLCPGVGLLATMPFAGALTGRLGCRWLILISGALVLGALPALAGVQDRWALGALLVVFGAASGLLDVSMNMHAVLVERAAGRGMMSGFHGLWSIGGVAGAGLVSLLLITGLSPVLATGAAALIVGLLLLGCRPLLLQSGGTSAGPLFAAPRGVVMALGACCFILFLAEGSVTDWSGVLLSSVHGMPLSHAGVGYVAFAAAMTVCRLVGDGVVRGVGPVRVVRYGSACAAAGFLLASLVPSQAMAVLGFALVGVGASNVVPVLFSSAGRQTSMPTHLALPIMTTIGYTGHLAGPALIGFLAGLFSLPIGLAAVAGMLVVVSVGFEKLRV